jgi:hypothetical protein
MFRRVRLQVDVDIDINFWAILPALNFNLHSNNLEFEWLCFGIYIGSREL